MTLEEKLPRVKKNILLSDYTTFKIGGPAKYFFEAKTTEQLILAIKAAKQLNLPFFILGGGSNVLASDKGFDGLLIKFSSGSPRVKGPIIYAEAGAKLFDLVRVSSAKGLTGLEWAAGIPGSVAGAVYGNAGAFWFSMADLIKSVEVLDSKDPRIKKISLEGCRFSNKDSFFKHNKNLIILSVILKLRKGSKKQIAAKIKEYINYRKENHPLKFASAGCIFKNHILEIKNRKLFKKFPELAAFNKKGRIPSAFLVQKCGLKGRRIGDAQISEKHANFVVNLGNAKATDVRKLIKIAREKVKEKFGITLEEEIQYL